MFFDPNGYIHGDPAKAETEFGARRLRREGRQRAGLCRCMAQVAARRGFEAATIDDAVRLSGFGKATFYKLFEDKDACLLEGFERCGEAIIARVAQRTRYGEEFAEAVEATLRELLRILAAEPDVARLVLVEVRVAGPRCREAQQRWLERFAGLLEDADLRSGPGAGEATARMTVGALAFLLASKVSREETAELPGMLPDLLYVALAPYLGTKAAAEMRGREEGLEWISAEGVLPDGDRGGESADAKPLPGSGPTRGGRDPAAAGPPPTSMEAAMTRRAGSPQEAIEQLVEVVRAAAASEPDLAGQVEAGLAALLGRLAADPELAEAALAEGEDEGRDYWPYREALEGFVPLLERAVAEAGLGIEEPATAARAVVAGLTAVILREVDEGRGEELAALAPELVYLTLNPFAGTEVAAEAMRRCERG